LLRWIHLVLMFLLLLSYLNFWVPPKIAHVFVFTGLFFPWLLLFNIIFTIYWISDRSYFFIIPLLILILGGSHVKSIVGINGRGDSIPGSKEVVLISHNLHYLKDFYNNDRLMEGEELIKRMRTSEADIFCFQEFPRFPKNPLELPSRISRDTPFRYYKRLGKSDLYVFSKYPLKESGGEVFTNKVNGYQVVDVNLGSDRKIKIFNVHFASNEVSVIADKMANGPEMEESEKVKSFLGMLRHYRRSAIRRVEQGEEVLELVKTSEIPVLVAGDFNEVPQSFLYKQFKNNLADSFSEKGRGFSFSYNGRFPGLRIDYIFKSDKLNLIKSQVLPSDFSDHRQVMAVFEIN